ncbi:hypothetical protein M422DRAFT_56158 [Sphaerobolus stellatus SS14]|uniref:Uncharacterized protein n=1 Tax=Sphaerobolus stellatus (strain SS14) TaxID=990650 RepID=A0A0C9UHZ1_SPHS4|nr:hypothetical protein M422DRAFT_56158 [Sphaerobolus stellatus SS14]
MIIPLSAFSDSCVRPHLGWVSDDDGTMLCRVSMRTSGIATSDVPLSCGTKVVLELDPLFSKGQAFEDWISFQTALISFGDDLSKISNMRSGLHVLQGCKLLLEHVYYRNKISPLSEELKPLGRAQKRVKEPLPPSLLKTRSNLSYAGL